MKGIFRRACNPEEAERYCGKSVNDDFKPGILRFNGGYPTDTAWTEDLVDIVHPQQDWQVKSSDRGPSAFIQISLHQPELKFGISSTITLDDTEWEVIWGIWEKPYLPELVAGFVLDTDNRKSILAMYFTVLN